MQPNRFPFIVMSILFVLGILLASCAPQAAQPTSTSEPQSGGPRLRVINAGALPIEDLVILFPDERINFGDLAPGETSEYQPVQNGVYGYAAYELTHNGETVMQPVLDWMGASPLSGSQFTYVIDFDPTRPQMQQVMASEVISD
jgi:hypothetical protein